MRINLTLKELAKIVEGTLISENPENKFNSFETHSGKVNKNSVFWCLKGENYDAHNFLPQVIKKGVKAVVINKTGFKKLTKLPSHTIVVKDTLKALHKLSASHINKFKIKKAAVTGSNGKTTTKEMLKLILNEDGKTFANTGNLNNQFGVPFSILNLTSSFKYAVFELGAKRVGDIQETASLVKPDIAVITNVSPAHLEFFGNIKAIYKTKTEIIKYLKPGGTLIINGDNSYLKAVKRKNKITFGFANNCDIRITDGKNLILTYKNREHKVPVTLSKVNKLNAAAAAAAAFALGISWKKIKQGLKNFKPVEMRMQKIKKGKSLIIFDAYNANPSSMQNALEELSTLKTKKEKIAVLGDMGELGKFSKKYHSELGKNLHKFKFDRIFFTGRKMRYALTATNKTSAKNINYMENLKKLTAKLKSYIKKDTVILFKASRTMEFEKILKKL